MVDIRRFAPFLKKRITPQKDIDEKSELTIWTNTKYKAMTEVLEAGNIESMIDYLEYLDSVSVSPALLADMINELWSEAAVNADYNGLPFKEVSPAEVTSAMSELRLSPTLLDMLSPVSDSAGLTSILILPLITTQDLTLEIMAI